MKKIIIAIALLLNIQNTFAQSEFKKEWETKIDFDSKWNICNTDLTLILAGNLRELLMIDGLTGKQKWRFNVKEKLNVKLLEDWNFLTTKENEPIELVYFDKKVDSNVVVYLNAQTGEIDNNNLVLKDKKDEIIKTKSTMFTHSVFDQASNTSIKINYQDRLLKSAMGKGSTINFTVNAKGTYNWETTLNGKCLRHLCDNLLTSNEPDVMFNLLVSNDKVFVIYEGISVLDLKTGKQIWNTTFDNVQLTIGLRAKQEIGRSAMPITNNNAVFICDFSKGEKAIKKLDINTGNLIWKSDELKNSDVISQLLVANNFLVAKFGGYIRKEIYIPDGNGGIGDGTYKVKYDYEGNSEIRVYNIETGKPIWNSNQVFVDDKFSSSECSILNDGNKLIACSNKWFYIVNSENGTLLHKAELDKKTIGKPQSIFKFNNNYIVEAEEGIASYSATAQKNYAISTNKKLFTEFKGNTYIVWTEKDVEDLNTFIKIDLNTGKITGKIKKCPYPKFNSKGNFFVQFADNIVKKYSVE